MMGVSETRSQAPKAMLISVVAAGAINASSTKQGMRPRAPVKIFRMKVIPSFRDSLKDHCMSKIRHQAQYGSTGEVQCFCYRLAVRAPTDLRPLHRWNRDRCRAGFCRWVVEHEIQLASSKLLRIDSSEQTEVHHHRLTVADA